MVHAQTKMHPDEWNPKNSLGFWGTNRSPHSGHKTIPSDYHHQ